MLKIIDVDYIKKYQLHVSFNNGESGIIDLEPHLDGRIYQPLKDPKLFIQYGLINGTIEWNNGADFAPEFLLSLLHVQQLTSR